MEEERLISAAEAANLLGVTKTSLTRWDNQGVLCPVLRLGDWRIRAYRKADVDRWQRERERRAAAGEGGNGIAPQRVLAAARQAT